LEAVRALVHVVVKGLTHGGFHADQTFDHNVFDVGQQPFGVQTVLVHKVQQSFETPLVPAAVVVFVCVFGELVAELVDGVVSQVHLQVLFALLVTGVHLLLRAETHESVVLHLNLQGVEAGYNDLDSDVKFVVVHEQGVADLLGHYYLTAIGDFGVFVGQLDALALGAVGGFDDEPLLGVFDHVVYQYG